MSPGGFFKEYVSKILSKQLNVTDRLVKTLGRAREGARWGPRQLVAGLFSYQEPRLSDDNNACHQLDDIFWGMGKTRS